MYRFRALALLALLATGAVQAQSQGGDFAITHEVIAGGGAAVGSDPAFADVAPNAVTGSYASIGGGYGNSANGTGGVVAGRRRNVARGQTR